ncbi:MAG TPA: YfiR family protein [Puia sp.]|jgi:hypothetical protein|nr:YfiR family protein [Puia sp.]
MHSSKRIFVTLLLFLAGILTGGRLWAQTNPIYPIEANIVYHFTKYIDWPNKDEPGDFVIGVIGNSPVFDEMVKLMGQRTAGGKKITIKKFQPNSGSFVCHILFITEEAHSCLKTVAAQTAASAVLIVCEGAGLARKGAAIDLVLSDEHLKLEINKDNIERHKLQVASELLQLATVVK